VSGLLPADGRRRLALVTGSAGQDGRHLTARLVKAGYGVDGTGRPRGENHPTALTWNDAAVIYHRALNNRRVMQTSSHG
jgi:GDP-D-mannose dehydratase